MKSLIKHSNGSSQKESTTTPSLDRVLKNDFMDMWNNDIQSTVPSINITEGKNNYTVEMAAPGLKKDDFNISISGNLMTISSEKESEVREPKNGPNYSRMEYNYSSFSRSFSIPENTDTENIKAKYTDGILNLTIPKKGETKSTKGQKIKVD